MTIQVHFQSSSCYRFKKRIGSGGCADVHLYSRHTEGLPDQDVVIKVLRYSDEATVKELLNEGLKLARLRHPNILTAFGYEKIGDRFGLVLEYMPGRDLKHLVHRIPGNLRHEVAVYVVRVMGEALAAAHSQFIIHGDISARNVLVSENGQLKLSDFGLSRRINMEIPGFPRSKGSMDYLAPERWSGAPASMSTDIFALGVLAFEILSGQNPLQSDSVMGGRERSQAFHRQKPWRQYPHWTEFFRGIFEADPAKRWSAGKILEILPETSLPSLELQRHLAACVEIKEQDGSLQETQPMTRTILLQSWERLRRTASPWWVQTGAVLVFAFFLVVSGATGMDHGVSGFFKPYLLTLTSDPWGEVFIDGRSQGYTPLLNLPISAGAHELTWRGRSGSLVNRSLMAFPNGSAVYQIIQKRGQPLWVAPVLRNRSLR